MINISSNELEQAYVGSTPVDSIYLGSEKVWPEETENYLYDPGLYLVVDGGSAWSPDLYNERYSDYSSVWGIMVTDGYRQVIIRKDDEYGTYNMADSTSTSYTITGADDEYDGQTNTTTLLSQISNYGATMSSTVVSSYNTGMWRAYIPAIGEL